MKCQTVWEHTDYAAVPLEAIPGSPQGMVLALGRHCHVYALDLDTQCGETQLELCLPCT